MNREVLRAMDTDHIPTQRLVALLETFGIKHAARALPDLLESAEQEDATCKQFLLSCLETEVAGRNERRRKRNYSAAHFPPFLTPLEEFCPEELESQFKDEYAEVIRLLKKGYSVKAVAQLQGISPTTVMKVKKMFIIKSVEK